MDVEFYQELFQHLLRCPMLFIPQFFNMDCQGTPYPFFFYRWLHLLFCFLFIIISLILCSICQHSQNFVLCFLSFLLRCFVLISFVLFLCLFLFHLTETIISTKFCHYHICFINSSQNWSWDHFFQNHIGCFLKLRLISPLESSRIRFLF